MSEHDRSPRPAAPDDPRLVALAELLGVIDRLRGEGGCPWDLEQTARSFAPALIEESFEAVEAVESGDGRARTEELGDVTASLVLLARISEQEGSCGLAEAARAATDKLVRRHPHVFGSEQRSSSGEVLESWEAIKKAERTERGGDDSALAGVPVALPATQRAQRLGGKAMAAGFRWADAGGAYAKLEEELGELLEARDFAEGERRSALEHELGDLLLAAAQLANYEGLDAEACARAAGRRFESRFRAMEAELDGRLANRSLAEMMEAWKRAKEIPGD